MERGAGIALDGGWCRHGWAAISCSGYFCSFSPSRHLVTLHPPVTFPGMGAMLPAPQSTPWPLQMVRGQLQDKRGNITAGCKEGREVDGGRINRALPWDSRGSHVRTQSQTLDPRLRDQAPAQPSIGDQLRKEKRQGKGFGKGLLLLPLISPGLPARLGPPGFLFMGKPSGHQGFLCPRTALWFPCLCAPTQDLTACCGPAPTWTLHLGLLELGSHG